MFPSTTVPVEPEKTVTAACENPPRRLPAPGAVPPIVESTVLLSQIPLKPPGASPARPDAVVPTRLPAMTVPVARTAPSAWATIAHAPAAAPPPTTLPSPAPAPPTLAAVVPRRLMPPMPAFGCAAVPSAFVPTRLPWITAPWPWMRTMPLAPFPLTTLSRTTTPGALRRTTPLWPEPVMVLPSTTAPGAGWSSPTPPRLAVMRFPSPADGPPTTTWAPVRAPTPLLVLPSAVPVRLRPIHEPRTVRPAFASAKAPLVQCVMLRPVMTTPVSPVKACRPVPTDGSVQCSSTSGTPPVLVPVTVVSAVRTGSCVGPMSIVPLPPASKTMSSGPEACASMIA